MGKIDDLLSRSKEVQERIEQILRLEKDIEEKEKAESAELQKTKKIASRLKSSSNEEILEEEVKDFIEAVKVFKMVSEELHRTADDMHKVVEEVTINTKDELQIIEGLANGSLQINRSNKSEELAECLNSTHVNIERLIDESQQARKEAQEAQSEVEQLTELEGFIERIDQGRHNLSEPETVLKNAKQDLQDAEWKLGEIPDKVQEAKTRSQRTVEEIESNVNQKRRNLIKGVGAVSAAALTGLAGCNAPVSENKNTDINYSKNYNEKLRRANPQDKTDEVEVGNRGKANKFGVEDAESKTIAVNGNEHVIEVLNVTSENAVIRIDNSPLVRVKQKDVLRISNKGLEVRGTLSKEDGGLVVFDIVDKKNVNTGFQENEGTIYPRDQYFVLGTGEELTFAFKGSENKIGVRHVEHDRAVVSLNGEVRRVDEGDNIDFYSGGSSDKTARIWISKIFDFGNGEGKIKFAYQN